VKIKTYLLFFVITVMTISYSISASAQNQQDMSNTDMSNQDTSNMKMGEAMEMPHPFFTHMGMPEGVGTLNLRLAGLAIHDKGKTEGDFAFHLETGLTKYVGLHIRNDRFRYEPRTELMFQFIGIKSGDGMSGLSPYIEFEVPTKSGQGKRIYTLVGFSTALSGQRISFNQAVEYKPEEKSTEGSVALVLKLSRIFFPVVEVSGEKAYNVDRIFNVLGGMKIRISENIVFGLAVQAPVTKNKDFSSEIIFQTDIGW